MHAPVTQAELVQAEAVPHVPLAEQVCTPLLEHCVDPGTQTPVQLPLAHANVHAEALPHCPVALHVCTPLPEHCTAPGVHTPVHAPLTHAVFVHATGAP